MSTGLKSCRCSTGYCSYNDCQEHSEVVGDCSPGWYTGWYTDPSLIEEHDTPPLCWCPPLVESDPLMTKIPPVWIHHRDLQGVSACIQYPRRHCWVVQAKTVWLWSDWVFKQRTEICPGHGLYGLAHPRKFLSLWGSLEEDDQQFHKSSLSFCIDASWWLRHITSATKYFVDPVLDPEDLWQMLFEMS